MLKRKIMSFLIALMLTYTGFFGVFYQNIVYAATLHNDYTSHPASVAIDLGLQKGYLWLSGDGNFYPQNQITQGQFIASLVAIRDLKEAAPVPQLAVGHWAKQSYEKAQKAGMLADVKIDPNKRLTKEEAAALVFTAWKPIRGEKNPNLTNTGALITWGWMKPAPSGQPKFREDLPVTKADAAEILRYLWQDKWQLEQGAKYATEFHKSLKILDGKITGEVPKGDNNFKIEAMFFTKKNAFKSFINNQSFSVPLGDLLAFSFSVINSNDSTDAGIYMYERLPSLERKNNTQKFHFMKGNK
ncbi:SLH domain-containing protein [Brevibacillus sp. IT-7CA2]|uniref:S-layer homology domain-containing protein n=1 Tax=Brevibacillus sp. IT-7CA2 TaxID=3026436 RepID=UPI0039DF95DD